MGNSHVRATTVSNNYILKQDIYSNKARIETRVADYSN